MLVVCFRVIREAGMGKPYSMDLRERVVVAIEGGMSTRQAAARFAIGIATAETWARLKRATGDVRSAKQGKPKGSVLDAHADFVFGVLAEAPDTTLDEMRPAVPSFSTCRPTVLTSNPIENAFAKFKALVRMVAARTFDALETAAANALE